MDELRTTTLTPIAKLTGFAGTCAGFLFGYDIGVMSGAIVKLVNDTKHDEVQWGLQHSAVKKEIIVTMAIAMAAVGSILNGKANAMFGRRLVLILGALIFTVGSLMMGFAQDWIFLSYGRGTTGLGFGLLMTTAPMYIAEQMPFDWRGPINVSNQLMITLGAEVAAIIDGLLANTPGGWRFMLGFGAVPSLLMVALMFKVPESCRWLTHNGFPDKGKQTLVLLRGTVDVDEEWELIEAEKQRRESEVESSYQILDMLKCSGVRRALLVGVMLQIFQQFTGINYILYYSSTIIMDAGIAAPEKAIWTSAVINAINSLFTIIGVYSIEKVGRKILLLLSFSVMFLSVIFLTIIFRQIPDNSIEHSSYYTWAIVAGLCLFCAGFGPGVGPLPWTISAEIYPMWCRDTAFSITSLTNWICNSIVTLTFLSLSVRIGSSNMFLMFTIIISLALVYFSIFLPETRGLPLEKVNLLFEKQSTFLGCSWKSENAEENEVMPLTAKQ